MTISPDLMLAILSLDSYNRGYGAGISDGGGSDPDGLGETGRVGLATILEHDDLGISPAEYQAWRDAGFYATAYDIGGETVISYRGTDWYRDPTAATGGNDVSNGYGLALGVPGGPQADLAVKFYKSVAGVSGEALMNTGITVTGHSMGAGQAGYVAALFGLEGVLYDNMH